MRMVKPSCWLSLFLAVGVSLHTAIAEPRQGAPFVLAPRSQANLNLSEVLDVLAHLNSILKIGLTSRFINIQNRALIITSLSGFVPRYIQWHLLNNLLEIFDKPYRAPALTGISQAIAQLSRPLFRGLDAGSISTQRWNQVIQGEKERWADVGSFLFEPSNFSQFFSSLSDPEAKFWLYAGYMTTAAENPKGVSLGEFEPFLRKHRRDWRVAHLLSRLDDFLALDILSESEAGEGPALKAISSHPALARIWEAPPETRERILGRLYGAHKGLSEIHLRDRGNSVNDASGLMEALLRKMRRGDPPKSENRPRINLEKEMKVDSLPVYPQVAECLQARGILGEVRFVRAQGRTLIYEGNQFEIGIKLLKDGEDPALLLYEAEQQESFQGDGSAIPEPLKDQEEKFLFQIKSEGFSEGEMSALEQQIEKATNAGKSYTLRHTRQRGHVGIAYKVKKESGYFVYLSDPSLDEDAFKKVTTANFKALSELAKRGMVHPAISDLFHNVEQLGREDRGRFLWMVDLVRPMAIRQGTGRLHGWPQAVEYPNMRQSGLADLADVVYLDELIQDEAGGGAPFSGLRRYNKAELHFYRASFFGDYLLAWTLIVGKRFAETQRLDWKDPKKVRALAQLLKWGYNTAYEYFTGEAVPRCLEESIDWERWARQMAFFMTEDYVSHLESGRIPEAIFGEGVNYSISVEGARGWDQDHGWRRDGKTPDLGPVNGALPLQEMVRALYFYSATMSHRIAWAESQAAASSAEGMRSDLLSLSPDPEVVSSSL